MIGKVVVTGGPHGDSFEFVQLVEIMLVARPYILCLTCNVS